MTIFLILTHTVYSQQATTYYDKKLGKEQMKEDYNILYNSLINYHPNPFLYTSESDLNHYVSAQLLSFEDSLTERGFYLVTQKLIAKLKCGHTYGKLSDEWYKSISGKNVLLPFNIMKIGENVYIDKTINEQCDFSPSDEILSINNISIQEILQEMSSIQERDGNTQSFVNEIIIRKFRAYYVYLYGIQDEVILKYKNNEGSVKSTKVKLSNKKIEEKVNPGLPLGLKTYFGNSWSIFAVDTATNTAYLKIMSFRNRKEYKKYYKEVFTTLTSLHSPKLIIDLRDNSGGYFRNGNNFLTYLTPNKFEFNFQRPKRKFTKNEHTFLDKSNKLTKLAFSLKPSKHRVGGQRTHTFTYLPSKQLYNGKINVITNGISFLDTSYFVLISFI